MLGRVHGGLHKGNASEGVYATNYFAFSSEVVGYMGYCTDVGETELFLKTTLHHHYTPLWRES